MPDQDVPRIHVVGRNDWSIINPRTTGGICNEEGCSECGPFIPYIGYTVIDACAIVDQLARRAARERFTCYQCMNTCSYADNRCPNCGYCLSCCPCQACEACSERIYRPCRRCRDEGVIACPECCPGHIEYVNSYSYIPPVIPFRSENGTIDVATSYGEYPSAPSNARYLGLEIETEIVDYESSPETVGRIWWESGFGYGKHDGSLTNGVECVTYPTTYQCLEDNDLTTTLNEMRRAGARAWNTGNCGLHVHVSRDAFIGKSHLWKFCHALQSMARTWIKLAGRNSGQWASWQFNSAPWDGNPYPTKVVAGKRVCSERYTAINLLNSGTVELRFWRGSVQPERVLGVAAIVDALIQWTGTLTFADIRNGITFPQFANWCSDNLPDNQVGRIIDLLVNTGVFDSLAATTQGNN